LSDNLDDLLARASEFDVLLTMGHDLWAADPAKAKALETIPVRIALAAWNTATVQAATIAVGIRAWAEVRGVLINCQDRVQLTQACPVLPNPDLEPAWKVLADAADLRWGGEVDAWTSAQDRAPRLAGLTYRSIGRTGVVLAAASVGAGA
jgi:hypothetical protein